MGKYFLKLDKFDSENLDDDIIDPNKYYNVFNPSLLYSGELVYVTFRAFSNKNNLPFHSFMIIYDKESKFKKEINLTDICLSFNILNCSDPKLLFLGKDIWVTFNTGYTICQNSIYLLKVSGEIGKPFECILTNRTKIEKNWAFFLKDQLIHAIYSLTPFREIYLTRIDEEANVFYFEFAKDPQHFLNNKPNLHLSIGTQLSNKEGMNYLIAHRKIIILNKKIYIGYLVQINEFDIKVLPKRLFHSYLSLFGSLKKFNKTIISCTYFSGLFIHEETFIISYGINDNSFAIKMVPFRSLCE